MTAAVLAPLQCRVDRVTMQHPGDVAAVRRLFDEGKVAAERVIAIFGKTEGNGGVNDFTRSYAVNTLQLLLSEKLGCSVDAVSPRIALVMSGGTEGGLSPHFLVFSIDLATLPPSGASALAIGRASTRDFLPEEIGRSEQVEETAAAVRRAMMSARIGDEVDVHYVQVKCPLLTNVRVSDAVHRGKTVVTAETYKSMAYSRGASALGVAVALGEVDIKAFSDPAIGNDVSLWSGRASTSAGIELMCNEVVVLGNSALWSGDLQIAHAVMRDALDLTAVQTVLEDLQIPASRQIDVADAARICAVLAKAEPSRDGMIRDRRHTMLDDSDISSTRHARALVGGVIAGLLGQTDLFVSGGAEHQGPDGGGPIAIIARRRG